MNLFDLVWLLLAWLVSVAAILRWHHVYRWRDDLQPRDRTLDLTGRRLGR